MRRISRHTIMAAALLAQSACCHFQGRSTTESQHASRAREAYGDDSRQRARRGYGHSRHSTPTSSFSLSASQQQHQQQQQHRLVSSRMTDTQRNQTSSRPAAYREKTWKRFKQSVRAVEKAAAASQKASAAVPQQVRRSSSKVAAHLEDSGNCNVSCQKVEEEGEQVTQSMNTEDMMGADSDLLEKLGVIDLLKHHQHHHRPDQSASLQKSKTADQKKPMEERKDASSTRHSPSSSSTRSPISLLSSQLERRHVEVLRPLVTHACRMGVAAGVAPAVIVRRITAAVLAAGSDVQSDGSRGLDGTSNVFLGGASATTVELVDLGLFDDAARTFLLHEEAARQRRRHAQALTELRGEEYGSSSSNSHGSSHLRALPGPLHSMEKALAVDWERMQSLYVGRELLALFTRVAPQFSEAISHESTTSRGGEENEQQEQNRAALMLFVRSHSPRCLVSIFSLVHSLGDGRTARMYASALMDWLEVAIEHDASADYDDGDASDTMMMVNDTSAMNHHSSGGRYTQVLYDSETVTQLVFLAMSAVASEQAKGLDYSLNNAGDHLEDNSSSSSSSSVSGGAFEFNYSLLLRWLGFVRAREHQQQQQQKIERGDTEGEEEGSPLLQRGASTTLVPLRQVAVYPSVAPLTVRLLEPLVRSIDGNAQHYEAVQSLFLDVLRETDMGYDRENKAVSAETLSERTHLSLWLHGSSNNGAESRYRDVSSEVERSGRSGDVASSSTSLAALRVTYCALLDALQRLSLDPAALLAALETLSRDVLLNSCSELVEHESVVAAQMRVLCVCSSNRDGGGGAYALFNQLLKPDTRTRCAFLERNIGSMLLLLSGSSTAMTTSTAGTTAAMSPGSDDGAEGAAAALRCLETSRDAAGSFQRFMNYRAQKFPCTPDTVHALAVKLILSIASSFTEGDSARTVAACDAAAAAAYTVLASTAAIGNSGVIYAERVLYLRCLTFLTRLMMTTLAPLPASSRSSGHAAVVLAGWLKDLERAGVRAVSPVTIRLLQELHMSWREQHQTRVKDEEGERGGDMTPFATAAVPDDGGDADPLLMLIEDALADFSRVLCVESTVTTIAVDTKARKEGDAEQTSSLFAETQLVTANAMEAMLLPSATTPAASSFSPLLVIVRSNDADCIHAQGLIHHYEHSGTTVKEEGESKACTTTAVSAEAALIRARGFLARESPNQRVLVSLRDYAVLKESEKVLALADRVRWGRTEVNITNASTQGESIKDDDDGAAMTNEKKATHAATTGPVHVLDGLAELRIRQYEQKLRAMASAAAAPEVMAKLPPLSVVSLRTVLANTWPQVSPPAPAILSLAHSNDSDSDTFACGSAKEAGEVAALWISRFCRERESTTVLCCHSFFNRAASRLVRQHHLMSGDAPASEPARIRGEPNTLPGSAAGLVVKGSAWEHTFVNVVS